MLKYEETHGINVSEIGVEALIYFSDIYSFDNVATAYLFPAQKRMNDHMKARIRPEFEANPYYHSLVSDNNSLDQMSIRNSRVFFRSGSSPAQVEGIAINMAMMDEYERYAETPSETSVLESLKSDTKYGLIRRWSTPSADSFGIDARFQESDQRCWMIKCEHCGEWQVLDFKKNIKVIDESGIDRMAHEVRPHSTDYICQKCGKSLESSRWYSGEWVAKHPDREARGYRISQMNAVWLSSDKIYQDYLRTAPQWFYNYTLGTPYSDESMKLTKRDIIKAERDDLPEELEKREDPYKFIAAGIDWGQHAHHLSILGMKSNGVVDLIALKRFATSTGVDNIEQDLHQIIMYLNQFEPDIICADIGYSGNYVSKLTQYFGKGVVYGVQVRTAKSNGDYLAHFNENDGKVTIDKLMQNILFITNVKAGRIGIYKKFDANKDIFVQHCANVIIRDVEEDDGTTSKVISRKGGDHWAQASCYAMVGMNRIIEINRDGVDTSAQMTSLDTPDTPKIITGDHKKVDPDKFIIN